MIIYKGYNPLKAPAKTLEQMNLINATHVEYYNLSNAKTFLMTKKGVENEIFQKSLASRKEKDLANLNCKDEVQEIKTKLRDEYLYEMDMLGVDEIVIKEGFGKETIFHRN